jgi:thymidine phosphorylase
LQDILIGRYSDVHIASFLTACANRLDLDEIADLTRAMVDVGARLAWPETDMVGWTSTALAVCPETEPRRSWYPSPRRRG